MIQDKVNGFLPVSTPERQGVPSRAILEFLARMEALNASSVEFELRSLIILRHGRVVAEGYYAPYGPGQATTLFSLSKSFTSTAVGLAVAEGLLTLEDRVIDLLPEEAPKDGPYWDKLNVHHLLSMTTGHKASTTQILFNREDGDWVRAFFSHPLEYEPGRHFVYDTGASYLLACIVEKLAGQRLVEYLYPRLFAPLGIKKPVWEQSPQGIDAGGLGLWLTPRDVAKFCQLYLQGGMWQGKRLLSEEWVRQAGGKQTDSFMAAGFPDSNVGYGYQFWRCNYPTAYRADGAFSQFGIIVPEKDVVVVGMGAMADGRPFLEAVWEQLLPAMQQGPLEAAPVLHRELETKLARLSCAPPVFYPLAENPSVLGREIRLDLQDGPLGLRATTLCFEADGCHVKWATGRSEGEVLFGPNGVWVQGEMPVPKDAMAHFSYAAWGGDPAVWGSKVPITASHWWADESTLVLVLRMMPSPILFQAVYHFTKEGATVNLRVNVSMLEDKRYPACKAVATPDGHPF